MNNRRIRTGRRVLGAAAGTGGPLLRSPGTGKRRGIRGHQEVLSQALSAIPSGQGGASGRGVQTGGGREDEGNQWGV